MIMKNENEKLSRNRKRRIERKIKLDDKMRTLFKKIKCEQKKKKNIDKIKELEIELVKIKYANIPNKLQSQLKELKKITLIKNYMKLKLKFY